MRIRLLSLAVAVTVVFPGGARAGGAPPCPAGQECFVPAPSSLPLATFEPILNEFLSSRKYAALGFAADKGIRGTGPWINKYDFGTHPAVRIYYSPAVMTWLNGGRKGAMPDGAMIIKEQYDPPADRYIDQAPPAPTDWTVMIRDSRGSKDGWFWGEYWTSGGWTLDDNSTSAYPNMGFGLYCVRCHGAAESESTFSSLTNITGYPGEPLVFRSDDSWMDLPRGEVAAPIHHHDIVPHIKRKKAPKAPPEALVASLLPTGPRLGDRSELEQLPVESWDHVVSPPGGPGSAGQFLTSDQCLGCHGATNDVNGPRMFLPTGPRPPRGKGQLPGVNVSPYGEWRWSPMGLAGRDPIFYSQFESELAMLAKTSPKSISLVKNLCFRCHGVMGKRQQEIDSPGASFDPAAVLATDGPLARYGALARDGVSCAVCHHIAADNRPFQEFLATNTGDFRLNKPDEIYGPFDPVSAAPMEHSLGITPKYEPFVKSSRLCGSCHVIDLPIVDAPANYPEPKKSIEQATYLEWLNSKYQDEFSSKNAATVKTCQDCHMRGSYKNPSLSIDIPQLQERIATVQDETFPMAEHRLPIDKIRVRLRKTGFARHELLGLNAFLLSMFNQFNEDLGVRKEDFMTSNLVTNLPYAIENLVGQASRDTATIEVSPQVKDGRLLARVKVQNLAGHKLPSGVGFRRLFLSFEVLAPDNGKDRIVWASGRTNPLGFLTDEKGKPLPAETFASGPDGKQTFHPHYQKISRQDQVQVYEELVQNAKGQFTTSFLLRDHILKDNRLLPAGWTAAGPAPAELKGRWLEATFPEGEAREKDPDYRDGSGGDTIDYEISLADLGVANSAWPAGWTVRATLWSQSTPPYYLMQRFEQPKPGPAVQRLFYFVTNLKVKNTPIQDWRLRLVSAVAAPASGG